MKRSLLIVLILLLTTISNATVDQLYINNITDEYQYTDNYCLGFIGWHRVKADPSKYPDLENKLLESGYTKMKVPYKVEIIISIIAVLSIATLIFTKKWQNSFKFSRIQKKSN